MNPKLMAALKAKRKAPESMPASGSPGTPSGDVGVTKAPTDEKGPDYHHEQVRRHLEKGLASTRRSAKLHLKMAKYHHDCACGVNHSKP